MSSIAAGVNAERTNRWLLIGALVLAVLAGILVFALLANFGGDDDGGTAGDVPEGSNRTLVAKQDIAAGTTLSGDMFDVREYDDSILVSNPIQDLDAVEGQVTSSEILKGNQISTSYLQSGFGADELDEQLPFLFEKGLRAIGVASDDVVIAGGHVRPGDYVDVIWRWRETPEGQSDIEFLHTEYLFQNIEVLARTNKPVDGVVVLDANGAPIELSEDDKTIARRNGEVAPEDDAHVVVLRLTPEETLRIMSAIDLGVIIFSLRSYGDDEIREIPPIIERVTTN